MSKEELEVGIKVEMEHTKNPAIARKIALDHLREFPDYYSRLYKAELIDEPEAISLAKQYFDKEKPVTEGQSEDVVGTFILKPISNNFELYGKDTNIKLGSFIKTTEGFQFVSANPMFHYFRYRYEPFETVEDIKRALSLIKKTY